MSLYSKYRPQNFANLVGQDHIRQTILNEIAQNSLTHAYLFAGPRGTGKTSTARLIAKALNCENKKENSEPCDECDFCTTIKDGNLIDVIEIDAASNRGIDEIRDLREKIKFAPTRAKSKTYIIDEVHMLTKEAFNALLKTLEEPPENVYFILCTTEIHRIPETIISRCQRFDFKRIDVKTIMTRLNYISQMEGIEAEDAAIDLIARHVEGGLRDAIGLFEQMSISGKLTADHVRSHLGITGHETIKALIDLLEKRDTDRAIKLVNEVHHEGYDLASFAREILECLRERLIESVQAEGADTSLWISFIERFEEARDMLRNTVIPQLPLEMAVIRICGDQGSGIRDQGSEKKESELNIEESTEKAQKEEEKTAATLKQEIEMERFADAKTEAQASQTSDGDLRKLWPRVMEHVQPPSLRRSLADAKISEGTDGTLTLTFGAQFHMAKANLAESRGKIEKAIEHLCGKKLKVACVLDTLAPKETPQKAPAKKKPESTEDLAKKAMEIFGDE